MSGPVKDEGSNWWLQKTREKKEKSMSLKGNVQPGVLGARLGPWI